MKEKKMKPKGKVVSGKDYSAVLEKKSDRKSDKQNRMVGKPADISMAMKAAKMGYSDKPKVKPQKKA
jgi:hypothetical protein